jgi:hypothetical protein
VDEHFMLPFVGMQRRMAPRGNFEDPHIKISSAVRLAGDHPGVDPLAVSLSISLP